MKYLVITFILFCFIETSLFARHYQGFDKASYYKIIKDGSVDDINKELESLNGLPANDKEAYEGTLLMKKAGLVKKPKDKLDNFKKGRIKLETVMHADNANVEYHFLRLIIQEHAPKITKYRAQVTEDSEYIKKNFGSLPPAVQEIVKDYSKTSNILHPSDF